MRYRRYWQSMFSRESLKGYRDVVMTTVENSVFCKESDILKYELEKRVHEGRAGDFPHALEDAHKLFDAFEAQRRQTFC